MNNFLRNFWQRSFKAQLMFGLSFALILLSVTFTYSVIKYQSDFLQKEGLQEAKNRSLSLATISTSWILANDYMGLDEVMNNFSVYDNLIFATVINIDGKVLTHTDRSLIGKYIADKERIAYIKNSRDALKNINIEKILLHNDNFIDIIRTIYQKEKPIGFVSMRLDQRERSATLKNTAFQGIIFTLFAIIIGLLFAFLVARSLTSHLSKLIKSIKKLKTGNSYVKVDENGVRELSELSHEFNELVISLNASQYLNQQLTELLELAFIATQDGLWDWDIKNGTVYFSPLWKSLLGYKDTELSNNLSEWKSRVHPEDLADVIKALDEHLSGENPEYKITYRLRHKNTNWVWTLDRGKVLYANNGEAIRMVGTLTDMTKEKELQLRYLHQAQIIEQTVDSVISTDLKGTILNWNSGSQRLLGYRAEEIIGKNIEILYPKNNLNFFDAKVSELLEFGEFRQDVTLLRQDKSELSASLSLTLLKDESGKPVSIVCYSQDITKRKVAESELKEQKNILQYQANHDSLTALPNRLLFHDRLSQAIKKATRNEKQLAVFFIDLDRFKQINDSLGHDTGDKILKIVSTKLHNIMRRGDTLARLGGDEFTVLMEDLNNFDDTITLAKKILKSLIEPMEVDGRTLYISSSIGISLFPQDNTEANNLLKYADAAMYKAKDEGRDNYQFYSSEMTILASEHVAMETSLREALLSNQFQVFYQAQTNGETDKLVGMEALIRWNHPQHGLVSPFKFLPMAEETGLIVRLDQWVMKTAMSQIVKWRKNGLNPGKLAINLAIKQLQQKDLIKIIKNILEETKCKPEWIALEVTEGHIMNNPEKAIEILRQISDMGIELAVDDFGTGYSSLTYLKRLPINKLKIDQSFVQELPYNDEDIAITKSVIALSKNLNLNVIAEGVETKEQRDFLIQNGCRDIQGYFYGKPIPADEMEIVLKKK